MGSQPGANFSLRILVANSGTKHDDYRGLVTMRGIFLQDFKRHCLWRSRKGNFDQKGRKFLNFSRTWLSQRTGQDTLGAWGPLLGQEGKSPACLDLQSPLAASSMGCSSLQAHLGSQH